MLKHPTIARLHELRLFGMARALEEQDRCAEYERREHAQPLAAEGHADGRDQAQAQLGRIGPADEPDQVAKSPPGRGAFRDRGRRSRLCRLGD